MDTEEQIFALMAAAETQQKESAKALEILRAELVSLANTRKALEAGVDRAARSGVSTALASAPAEAAKVLEAASAGLTRAASRVEAAAQRLGWKTVAIVAASGLIIVTGVLMLGWYITPNPSEITALRADKTALEANLVALERRGGRVKLVNCGKNPGRLCAEIDESAGSFGDASHRYRVFKGY